MEKQGSIAPHQPGMEKKPVIGTPRWLLQSHVRQH